MKNWLVGSALTLWVGLVLACTITKQWPAVVCLFAVAWLIERAFAYVTEKE
jgi:hypothetical protein